MWTCSIYTKNVINPETENISDNILYTKCHKFAFLPLTQQLVTICNQKNYPFFLLATDKVCIANIADFWLQFQQFWVFHYDFANFHFML